MINRLSNLITELNNDKPLSIIRLGNVEATQMLTDILYTQMTTNAGFFGDTEALKDWKKMMLMSLLNADCNQRVITCSSFSVCDDVLTKLNIFIPTLPYIEDITFWVSIINNIKSNKLGFVSYFKDEIDSQLKYLDKIHIKNKIKVLTTNWKIIKSENTIKGNEPPNKSWNIVFNELLDRCLNANCDVYFLSCGCYGVPLCYELKKRGKKAIYVGGMLQLFFGLKGKRWDNREVITQFYNKYWKYPSEKPINNELVEDWCYGE